MKRKRVKLAITGGGTGGHLSPAVAVIEELQAGRNGVEADLLYIGSRGGSESRVVPLTGVPFKVVATGKLRRYLSFANLVDTARLPLGFVQSLLHLARFRPAAVLATGGYVSVPPVVAAWCLRRPVLVHEQTGDLGLANRINSRFATLIALSVPGSERGLPVGKWVLTGNPVRSVVRAGNAARARTRFGLSPALPTVYVTGGAQGAHAVNELVRGSVSDLLQRVQLIHQCGDSSGTNEDYEALLRRAYGLPTALRERYVLMRYIGQEIGDVYAAADLVVGRAGAGTVNEIAVLRKPAVFIPLAHAANDEQRRNANRLAATGAAVVLDQAGLTPDRFSQEVVALATDPERLAAMAASSVASGLPDPAEHIATLLLELAGVAPVAAAAPDRSL